MDESTRAEPAAPTGSIRKKTGKGMLWAVLAIVIAFFAGFLWQFYEASTARSELTQVEQELALERLRVRLGQAALSAQAGNYEAARQQMSLFFSQLEEYSVAMPPEVTTVAENFLTMRDEVITGLSRSNPEYAGVLYGMLESLANAIEESAGGTAGSGMPTGQPPAAGPGAPAETGDGGAGEGVGAGGG